jgi:dTDP-glucose pyrophosphorylase
LPYKQIVKLSVFVPQSPWMVLRQFLLPRGEYELTDAIRDLAQSGKKVKALELTGEWADVRDPEILARLNR